MNNEFKKTASTNQTVYTLENATAGGSSSAVNATVSSPMGGVQKRGQIVTSSTDKKVPATTPRNFVAKNAKTGGAGAHKDKKKAEKQGTAKHKKPYMEALQAQLDQLKSKVAEGVATTMPMPDAVKLLRQYGADHFKTTSNELHFYKNGRHLSVDLVMNPDTTRSVSLSSLNAATRGLKGQGVAEAEKNPHTSALGKALYRDLSKEKKASPAQVEKNKANWAKNPHNPANKDQGVAEGFNGEYDDEAGMAESNLHTMARAVKGLMDTIDSNDNLPEWCQEKIAKAEMMVTGVWDYLLSQKEQGIDPEQGVAEVFADQGSGSTAKDNAEYMKRRKAAKFNQSAKPSKPKNQQEYDAIEKYRKDLAQTYNKPKKEQGVAEGSEIKIPTEDGITMQDIRLMAGEGPLTKKTVLQAIAVIRKQRRPQGVAEGDAYMESLQAMVERQLEPTMDLDAWNDNFQNADPQKYHQFKNKSPEKKSNGNCGAV